MPIEATIILDSGCFLPGKKVFGFQYADIGYYESDASTSDIRVYVDGMEKESSEPCKLGSGNSIIEVRHKNADGSIRKDGIKSVPTIRGRLVHPNRDLYTEKFTVDPAKFDCIIRFGSGQFRDSMVKKRLFKKHKKQPDGTFAHEKEVPPKEVGPVAHNIVVHFHLEDGEVLELVKDGQPFLSSNDFEIKHSLEIEVIADNSTAEKFYSHYFKEVKESYWFPNQGDPPPTCPEEPCPPNGGVGP